jgi:predicted transcriptional regulator
MTVLLGKPKRRDQFAIVAEIVDIAGNGTSKTHIMFKANLSFSQLNEYLEILLQKKLLEKTSVGGKEFYRATKKGLEFMEKQFQLIDLIKESM